MKVDMHVHTCASFDCLTPADALVRRADELAIDVLCITDHNEIRTALDMKQRWPDRIIVGEEVKTAEGVDVIGLFLTERIPARTPARETCEQIHAQGGLVYIPHPFAGGKGGGGRILPAVEDQVDVFEGFNARIHRPELNARAVSWAEQRGVPLGAGSDAHTLAEIGRAHVEVPPFALEPAAFLEALAQGRVSGVLSSYVVHLASTWAKLRKRLPGGGPS